MRCFERALTLDANLVDAWANLARLCREVGDFERAESAARQALQRNPNHVNALNILGSVLLDSSRAEARMMAVYRVCWMTCFPNVPGRRRKAIRWLPKP